MRLALFLLGLFTTFAAQALDNTDCHDPEALAGWHALLDKHPDDADLRALFGLRERLCEQVIDGRTDISEASERFEQARERLKKKWEVQNRARGLVGSGAG